jgi:hypothetical protein
LFLDDTEALRGSMTDVECGTAVDGGCPGVSYEGDSNAAMFGRCPGCDDARLRVYVGSDELVVVALGRIGFKAGGGTASGSGVGLTAGLVAGADAFDLL